MFRFGKRKKKKETSLFSQVYEVKNLTEAWRKVRSNVRVADRKHSQGVDLVSLQDFEANWEENMADLAIALEEGTYLPMPLWSASSSIGPRATPGWWMLTSSLASIPLITIS